MTQPPGAGRTLNLRGAVDLGALAARNQTPAGPAAGTDGTQSGATAGGYVRAVTDASFGEDVIAVSSTVPVVLDFWATWCAPCRQLSPVLEKLAEELAGRLLLATIDVDANPQLAQAFAVQSIPSVFAVLKGQPIPLFQGAQPEPQVRQVLNELLRVAAANGVNGVLPGAGPVVEDDAEPVEEALPPLHQMAYDAIERDDLDAAVEAYQKALRESPADDMARIGLSQVRLMQRTRDVDPMRARAAADADVADLGAQLLAADVDVLDGRVQQAFDRLIAAVRRSAGEDRDRAREHLVELFELVGADDPRVARARMALANALF